jgi:serine phosphatase RsbU (regulator of sigma subunit)/tetratricopeptide (TPR) repeat protein
LSKVLKYCVLTTLLCIVGGLTYAQTERIKRLEHFKQLYHQAEHDSLKARISLDVSDIYLDIQLDSAEKYAFIAIRHAAKAEHYSHLGKANNFVGICYLNRARLMTALEYFQKAYEAYDKGGDKAGVSKMLNNLGVIYSETNNYPKAIEIYKKAYFQDSVLGNWDQACYALHNIAINCSGSKRYDEAMHYAQKLRKHATSLDSELSVNMVFGDVHFQLGQLDSAEYYMELAVKEIESAQDVGYTTSGKLLLADIYQKKGKLVECSKLLAEVQQLILMHDLPDKRMEWLRIQSEYFEQTGQPALALNSLRAYQELSDSLDESNQLERLNEINAKFENDNIERLVVEQDLMLKQNRSQLILIVVASLLLMLICGAILYAFYKKRAVNSVLSNQNEKIQNQRQKIISSINYAKKIQQSTLPSEEDFENIFDEAFIYFKPKDIISGDFYSYQQIGTKTYIAAIDCTGHGVPGAFMSLIANAKLNKVVNEQGIVDPAQILLNLHREIRNALHQDGDINENMQDGVEMSICAIDNSDNTISFAGAGSNIMIQTEDGLTEYKGQLPGIGGNLIREGVQIETIHIPYRKGEVLFLFSDGYYDQIGGKEGKKLNKKKFREILTRVSEIGLRYGKLTCDAYISEWKMFEPQTDDMMVIGIRL